MTKQEFKRQVVLSLISGNLERFVPNEEQLVESDIPYNRGMGSLSALKASQSFMAFSINNLANEIVQMAYKAENTSSGEVRRVYPL